MAPLDIPASSKTVSVSIIDSTAHVHVLASGFIEPQLADFELLRACCFSFLVEHEDDALPRQKRRLVFDLGVRSDWATGYSPTLRAHMTAILQQKTSKGESCMLKAEKNVSEVLGEHGVATDSVEAIIWSHTHVDHIGNPATFGPSTALIVGPGFGTGSCGCISVASHSNGSTGSAAPAVATVPHLFPGYPADPESVLLESDYAGRELRELGDADFGSLTIGGFRAHDYFGDGSFYLLDTPGHSVGHVSGLARVSATDFILMGGDAFHHVGEMRPSIHVPLPERLVAPVAALRSPESSGLKRQQQQQQQVALFEASRTKGKSAHHDPIETQKTINKLQAFDGDEHILVVAAHDEHMMNLLQEDNALFPQTANDFVARGWKSRSRWTFLRDFGVHD